MRWVLYREAVAIFMEHKWRGVGTTQFGEWPCAGPGDSPIAPSCLSVRYGSYWPANTFFLVLFAVFLPKAHLSGNIFEHGRDGPS